VECAKKCSHQMGKAQFTRELKPDSLRDSSFLCSDFCRAYVAYVKLFSGGGGSMENRGIYLGGGQTMWLG